MRPTCCLHRLTNLCGNRKWHSLTECRHPLLILAVAPVLRSFRERLLGPLAEYDARRGAELLPTLRSFLACDGSWSACASRLYVHVNTVRYRIGRIEALTGSDLSALADRVDFFLALRGA